MKTLFIMGIISLLFGSVATAQDGKLSKKEQKRIVQLLSHSDSRKSPGFLENDMAAYSFAYELAELEESEYVRRMAEADARIEEDKYLDKAIQGEEGNQILAKVNEEDVARFLVNYRREAERFDMVRSYSRIRSIIREAAKQVMPTGRLLEVTFEESGGSMIPVNLYLKATEKPYTLQMRRINEEEGFSITIGDDVIDKVMELIETEKVYQSRSAYFRPADLPDTPRMLDGPGSWEFTAKFEGGKINSTGSRVMTPEGIGKVMSYLHLMLYDAQRKAKEEQEQSD